ncbi:MAG TPA: Uma2 family endonuclease [Gemmataceae bacterium]|nr:Uma2 family endonuclease [Gemmataceae bacterium]
MSTATLPTPVAPAAPATTPPPVPPVLPVPAIAVPLPFKAYTAFRRFRVDEYQKMIDAGILTDEDAVELLDGYVVHKMPRNPPHDGSMFALNTRLQRIVPSGWVVRCQGGTRLADSQPEPDLAIARGDERLYFTRQPLPSDLALVIEVADTSLDRDRHDKGRIYAGDGIPVYWVVNLVDRVVEVFSNPTGPVPEAHYQRQQVYHLGASVLVELDGTPVGSVVVAELMP